MSQGEENFHINNCIKNKIEEMNNPETCVAYLGGMLSARNPQVAAKITIGELKKTCEEFNNRLPLGFYQNLCQGINDAHEDAFQKLSK